MGEAPEQLPAPPPPPAKPFFRVAEVRANGSETTRGDYPWTVGDHQSTQDAMRAAITDARTYRDRDGLHTRVYSTEDDGTLDKQKNLGWDSWVNPY